MIAGAFDIHHTSMLPAERDSHGIGFEAMAKARATDETLGS